MKGMGDMMAMLLSRDEPPKDAGQQLLDLLKDPFSSSLASTSVVTALATSLGFTAFIALCFSFLRPYNQGVYAPKLKHANEKHAPPPLGKSPWAWFLPLWTVKESDLIVHVGMDATIFLRFTTMCRNIFLVLAVIGVAILLPVNLTKKDAVASEGMQWLEQITPLVVWGDAHWSQVVVAWSFNLVICGFLWWNYRKVLQLRRQYFQSTEYQNSLHARTLMLTDIPKERCSDEGIARIIDEVVPQSSFSRTAIARNVKVLPDLIQQHDHLVRKLEKVLAKYLKDPNQIPAGRPTCNPSKKDPSYGTYPRGQKVDAIEYLTQRIRALEIEIKEVRASVDRRSTMPYGFASYSDIAEAHTIAHACRKKHPYGSTITLAPRPNDIIWDNMPLAPATRSWKRTMNNLWVALLTILWIAPNAMIAIFLVTLSNLGKVWPAFQVSLAENTTFWGIVQGIANPAITSLIYLVLPIIFRRLANHAGDKTKTGRERHVLAKLYAFFVFNNLIVVSIFSSLWGFVAGLVEDTSKGTDFWKAVIQRNLAASLFAALCKFSPFWVTWLLQRNLGAAIDLAQLWTLIYIFFQRKFSHPTPRELIELTAPPAFDYASYYNYFLFYSTITLCYAGIQPLVLPASALYFVIDVFLKKYLILYVFVTKTESGGMFWRVLFNRFVFATMLANLVVFLTCWVRGDGTHFQAYAVAPLPFLMIAFKFYCSRVFDEKIHFYSTRSVARRTEEMAGGGPMQKEQMRSDRLASRFGHPALYKPLITPMVHQRAQNILHTVYKGRLSDGREAGSGDTMSTSNYSDTFALDPMHAGKPGKAAATVPGFEFVPESQLDFEFYKNRAEFTAEHGGGELYGRGADINRPGTPGSVFESEFGSRPGSPALGGMTGGVGSANRRVFSAQSEAGSSQYQPYRPPGHMSPPTPGGSQAGFQQQGMLGGEGMAVPPRARSPLYSHSNDSDTGLMRNAAAMPMAASGPLMTPGSVGSGSASREASLDRAMVVGRLPTPGPSTGALGGGPRGYSGLAQTEEPDLSTDPTQYDYFRGRSGRSRTPGQGW